MSTVSRFRSFVRKTLPVHFDALIKFLTFLKKQCQPCLVFDHLQGNHYPFTSTLLENSQLLRKKNMSTVSRFGSFSRDLRYGEIGDDQFHAIFDSKVMFTDALKCVLLPKSKVRMSGQRVRIPMGFSSFQVPPTTLFNPLGHFQAESAGRAWFVRKSSISATTFIFPILMIRGRSLHV